MLVLGDVHQKTSALKAYLQTSEQKVVCVGDLGFNYSFFKFPKPFMFIHGNHDNFNELKVCHEPELVEVRENLHHISFGTIWGNTLYLGGADSIDRSYRIEGRDWWPEEAITYDMTSRVLEKVSNAGVKISRVISHTCPDKISNEMLDLMTIGGSRNSKTRSRSEEMLQEIFDRLKPEEWYYGHWHFSYSTEYRGCRFRCLAEGEGLVVPD